MTLEQAKAVVLRLRNKPLCEYTEDEFKEFVRAQNVMCEELGYDGFRAFVLTAGK